MSITDKLPTMDDASLASLRVNATRLQAGAAGPRQNAASELLPLIEAELAEREARKPPKPVRAKAKPKAKAKVEAEPEPEPAAV